MTRPGGPIWVRRAPRSRLLDGAPEWLDINERREDLLGTSERANNFVSVPELGEDVVCPLNRAPEINRVSEHTQDVMALIQHETSVGATGLPAPIRLSQSPSA